MTRPDNVLHWKDVTDLDDSGYPGDDERLGFTAKLSSKLGLFRLGIGHEVLPPGRRTSYPHAELSEEEFVFVLEGSGRTVICIGSRPETRSAGRAEPASRTRSSTTPTPTFDC